MKSKTKLFTLFVISLLQCHICFSNPQSNDQSLRLFYNNTKDQLTKVESENTLDEALTLLTLIANYASPYSHRLHWIHSPEFSPIERIEYLQQVAQLSTQIDSKKYLAWAHLQFSQLYYRSFDFEKAMQSSIKANVLYIEIKDSIGLGMVRFIWGELFESAHLFSKAIEYYNQSNNLLNTHTEFCDERHFINHNHIGRCYSALGKYRNAIASYRLSEQLHLKQLPKEQFNAAYSFLNAKLGVAYLNLGLTDSAQYYIDSALKFTPQKNKNLMVIHNHLKGVVSLEQGKNEESIAYILTAKDDLESLNLSTKFPSIYRSLSQAYEATGKIDSSYKYIKKYSTINDDLKINAASTKSLLYHYEDQINCEALRSKSLRGKLWITILFSFSLFVTLVFGFIILKKTKKENILLAERAANITLLPKEKENIEENTDNNEDLKELAHNFEQLMIKEKLYLQHKLTLRDIAKHLNTNTTYLSKAINSSFNMNVNAFINKYRIDHAINVIKQGGADNLTIEAIAIESGFSNRVVFSSTFKSITGVTPSFFIKQQKTHP